MRTFFAFFSRLLKAELLPFSSEHEYPGVEVVTASFPLYMRIFSPVVPFSFPEYLVNVIHLLARFLKLLPVERTFDGPPLISLILKVIGFVSLTPLTRKNSSVQFGVKPFSNVFFFFKIRTRSPILNFGFPSTLSSRGLYNASCTC